MILDHQTSVILTEFFLPLKTISRRTFTASQILGSQRSIASGQCQNLASHGSAQLQGFQFVSIRLRRHQRRGFILVTTFSSLTFIQRQWLCRTAQLLRQGQLRIILKALHSLQNTTTPPLQLNDQLTMLHPTPCCTRCISFRKRSPKSCPSNIISM